MKSRGGRPAKGAGLLAVVLMVALASFWGGRLLWIAESSLAMDLSLGAQEEVVVEGWDAADKVSRAAGARLISVNGQEFSQGLPRMPAPVVLELETEGAVERWEWVFTRSLDRLAMDLGGAPITPPARPGHRVLSLEGRALNDAEALQEALQELQTSRPLLVVQSPDGERYSLVVQQLDFWAQAAIFAAGLGFVALAVLSLFWFQRSLHARAFFAFSCLCALFWWLRAIPFAARGALEAQLFLFVRALLPSAYLMLLTVFAGVPRSGRRRQVLWAGALVIAAFFVAVAWLMVPEQARHGLLGRNLSVVWLSWCLLLLLATLVLPRVLRRVSQPSAVDVQRARVLTLAAGVAATPVALDGLARAVSGQPLVIGRLAVELMVLFFPLLLAAALARGQFLRAQDVAAQSGQYLLVTAMLSGCFALLVAGVVPLSRLFLPADATVVLFVLVGLAVFVVSPLHERLIRRMNERVTVDLSTLSLDDSTQTLEHPPAFCNRLAFAASEALGAPVTVLVRNPATESWWLAARHAQLRSEVPDVVVKPALDRLVAERNPLFRHALAEDLSASDDDVAVVAALDTLGSVFAFPLTVEGEVWGCLGVGQKESLENFSAADMRRMVDFSKEAADGLYRAYLRSNPHGGELEGSRRVDGYVLEELLGRGATSVVYRASRGVSKVALKLMAPRALHDDSRLQRFEREARILSRIESPHVMKVLDTGVHQGTPYLVTELFESGTLRDLLSVRKKLEVREAVDVALDVAEGLEAALAQGVVHRDVTPRNIFLRPEGRAVIGDFGIASLDEATVLTTHFHMMGTPAYLSPEICRGEAVTWSADQYGLGVNLFEMLAGRRPFQGRVVTEIAALHASAPPPSLASLRPELPAALSTVVQMMLCKTPEERFDSYLELREALRSAVGVQA